MVSKAAGPGTKEVCLTWTSQWILSSVLECEVRMMSVNTPHSYEILTHRKDERKNPTFFDLGFQMDRY